MIDKILIHPALKIFEEGKPEAEIIPKRTGNTKTFYLRKKGKEYEFKIVVNTGLVHYKKGKKWEEIDLTLYEKNGKIVMDKASYKVEVFQDRIGYKCRFPDKSWFKMELVNKNKNFETHYKGNQFFWDGVGKGIDVKLQLQAHKPEIFTQIRDDYTSKKFLWKITESKSFNYESYGGDMDKNNLEIIVNKTRKIGKVFFYEEIWTGKVSRIFDKKTRIKRWEENPIYPLVIASESSYPVYIDPTITKTIPANASDGFQQGNNWKTTKVLLGYNSYPTRNYSGGFRFTSVNIPIGATINSAILKVKTKSGGTSNTMKVWGDKVANAAAWSGSSRPSQITKTVNSTSWVPVINAINSINVKSQVASIVGLGGWASNNAMRFAVLTPSHGGTKKFNVYDHNTSVANSAKLIITYTSGGATAQYYSSLATLGVG